MRKPDFCTCKNKDADQLCSYFVFATRFVQFLFLNRNFKLLACLCECSGWLVYDMVGDPEDHFSHVMAHLIVTLCIHKLLINDR